MRYDFSSHFLRIDPPDATFAQAWESLCFLLLCEEFGREQVTRLGPPDRGIDIWARQLGDAYQCKSSSHGQHGSVSSATCLDSLRKAVKHRSDLRWQRYLYALNARLSGRAAESIVRTAQDLGLEPSAIELLGPEYWDGLCCRFSSSIEDRFFYRVTLSEKRFIEAETAYRETLAAFGGIRTGLAEVPKAAPGVTIRIKNDLTQAELALEVPEKETLGDLSSKVLSILLRDSSKLLGASGRSVNFADLGASARVSGVFHEFDSGNAEQTIKSLGLKDGDVMTLGLVVDSAPTGDIFGVSEKQVYKEIHVEPDSRFGPVAPGAPIEFLAARRMESLVQDIIWSSMRTLAATPLITRLVA